MSRDRHGYFKAYQLAHPEKSRASSARYVANHPEKARAAVARYDAAHRSEARARTVAWRAANPEKRADQRARYRGARACEHAACLALGPIQLAWQTNPHKCYLCGTTVVRGANLHMDHVVPISKGGLHCGENIRPACAPCNMHKHDKTDLTQESKGAM